MKLTKDQHQALQWLDAQGGSGVVDQFGRVLAGGETLPCGTAWLKLISHGLAAGGAGRIFVTGHGQHLLRPPPTTSATHEARAA